MTTTPDSRIRADFGLPPGVPTREQAGHLVDQMTPELRAEMEAYWDRAEESTTATPDTSTTAGKISVMAAYDRGEAVQARHLCLAEWSVPKTRNDTGDDPCWDWSMYDYRIAPHPAPKTALQRAREHRSVWKGAHNPESLHLEPLLREIDNSKSVNIVWDGKGIYHFEHDGITPGRYRLLRDDT